ncbi:MAG: hypothetical protein Q8M88_14025 [Phenylobacterium sp.]|uniref:hypothetical protein n=1 Tax=Phenylobacterium sp. TaxID=1871053 RepID=UPI002736F026|nr:hypothetical protein [Phenylobacterium sp.]MDP3175545.1 hypothetical protein [Phenylobacterium sp.]
MHPFLRAMTATLLALSLGACSNLVYSDQPLFTATDSAGAIPMRPGVWMVSGDAECAFDAAAPLATWPECAEGKAVTRREARQGAAAFVDDDAMIAGGDPMVVQDPGDAPETRTSYFGLRVTRLDARSRAVEFAVWLVHCGPPPPPDPADPDRPSVTDRPLPGLEVRDANCVAHDKEAVRGAARASEAWDHGGARFRWIRDGRR